ncbi:MAG: hypothetical protein H8E41_13170 [Desulfobulbaceae bacterium]|uniref:Cytoplasmic protein n=1 Tax=Candidatus Desulfobia pelagia TaxID=2841692 RepID=A0A8J6NHX7_9BACT|nr:hypothetical protein [Candidatus Desulfobia pelagia]
MIKEDLIKKNPLRIISPAEGTNGTPKLGLVMARAGLGKTAILVQIALDSMLRGNKVLHVSIGQSLDKTRLWYDDIFSDIAASVKLENAGEVEDDIMRQRMIMTFNENTFSVAKLKERLQDLIDQDIFKPNCLLVDGFDCSGSPEQPLAEMRELMDSLNLNIWFSAVCHRNDDRVSDSGVPAPCHTTENLFDTIILLQPMGEGKSIALNIVKDDGGKSQGGKSLTLDPATLMIIEA